MKRALFLAAVLSLFACSSAPAQSGSEVAAKVGNKSVTTKELDERWSKDDPAGQAETTQKMYDGRRSALDAIIAESVIADAAKAKGMTPDAYQTAEIAKRLKTVTDSDVAAFYQANINQMQGRSLEVMSPAINRFLTEQQREIARQSLITELRKSGPAVSMMFDAPRRTVAVDPADPAIGNKAAPITLIEFADFQCPFCGRVAPTIKKLRETYGDKVRVVWKDFPLTQIHPQAFKAGEAAHCAGDQGKYWEYHDRLFANQQSLMPDDLKKHAADLGLDAGAFAACLDTSKYGERVRDGVAEGTRLGVNSTPMFYVNGRVVSGAQPYENFVSVIDEELARAKK
ncbi:MAG TPA: thioredoxin domain-containing protein [Vicinamibacterales bacterium]|nr:thioredoxin domain-containing protein [Vicinamibacterales bacterium]